MTCLPNPAFWRGRHVFLTGHTGFKGSWLVAWLQQMGADVTGYSLAPEEGGLYRAAGIDLGAAHHVGDVRQGEGLAGALAAASPEIVFHLAAQALVRPGYDDPAATFGTNVMGTVNLLDAVRRTASVRSVVVVTTDKCYENREWDWGYRETDRLGGRDPYSSSKACAELVAASYRSSFFSGGVGGPALATARAGNVVGAGDVSVDRLVPDVLRAVAAGHAVVLRNPDAVRPWLNVLDALAGYLLLAERLCEEGESWADAWNFGPDPGETVTVEQVVARLIERLGEGSYEIVGTGDGKHEARLLKLDSTRARQKLGWRPVWSIDLSLDSIAGWPRAGRTSGGLRAYMNRQIAMMEGG